MRAIPNSRTLRKAVRALEKAEAAGFDRLCICDLVGSRRYREVSKLARVEDVYLACVVKEMVRRAHEKVEPRADDETPF